MNAKEFLEKQVESWALVGYPALLERFVLRNGTLRERVVRASFVGEPKGCFKNAVDALEAGLTYEEGFAVNPDLPVPIHHAWLVDEEGTVHETTFRDFAKYSYMGVSIPRKELSEELLKNEVYGVLDPGWGLNLDFMFRRDPELREVAETVASSRFSP